MWMPENQTDGKVLFYFKRHEKTNLDIWLKIQAPQGGWTQGWWWHWDLSILNIFTSTTWIQDKPKFKQTYSTHPGCDIGRRIYMCFWKSREGLRRGGETAGRFAFLRAIHVAFLSCRCNISSRVNWRECLESRRWKNYKSCKIIMITKYKHSNLANAT